MCRHDDAHEAMRPTADTMGPFRDEPDDDEATRQTGTPSERGLVPPRHGRRRPPATTRDRVCTPHVGSTRRPNSSWRLGGTRAAIRRPGD